jgi:hypothetical protein
MGEMDLLRMESRLDAFDEWYVRVVGNGDGYDLTAALEDWELIKRDMHLLIEQARARA